MAKKSRIHRSRHSAALVFSIFILTAVLIVIGLEYIDYRQNRSSFLFTRILPPKTEKVETEKFHRSLLEYIKKSRWEYSHLKDRKQTVHIKITIPPGSSAKIAGEIEALAGKNGMIMDLADKQEKPDQSLILYEIRRGKTVSHMLQLWEQREVEPRMPPPPPEKKPSSQKPKIAIIIDDLGYSDTVAEQLHGLGIPVTGAVIPTAPYAEAEARILHRYGLETIIHLPMQSKNGNTYSQETSFISTSSSPEEIRDMITLARAILPDAQGVNNHMGSLITSRREWIGPVLQAIQAENLFFVDSRTAEDSAAFALAREWGIKTQYRDVFLDSEPSLDFSRAQIRQLVRIAVKKGQAVAIGHPFSTTLQALSEAIPGLKKEPLEIVFVSRLLQ